MRLITLNIILHLEQESTYLKILKISSNIEQVTNRGNYIHKRTIRKNIQKKKGMYKGIYKK